jgi:hypothetical protein
MSAKCAFSFFILYGTVPFFPIKEGWMNRRNVDCCELPLGLKRLPGMSEQNSEDGGNFRLNFRLGTFHTLLLWLLEREYEETTFFEIAVTVYQSTRRNIPEDSNVQQHRCEKLRSRNFKFPSWLVCCLARPHQYVPYQAAGLSSIHSLHNVSQGILSPAPCNCSIIYVSDNTSSPNLKVKGLGHFLSVRKPIFNGSQPKSIVTHPRSLCTPAVRNQRRG